MIELYVKISGATTELRGSGDRTTTVSELALALMEIQLLERNLLSQMEEKRRSPALKDDLRP